MAWLLFFLALLSYFSGICSQATLTQPASASVPRRQTIKLSCSGSRGGSWSTFFWFQQKPGQVPRFVSYSSSNWQEGIPNRFTGSSSGNTGYLMIRNTQPVDSAMYYCGAWEDKSKIYLLGGGTQLTVTGPTSPPNLHLFPPSQEEIETKKKATLVCTVSDFSPQSIKVTWKADGKPISSGVETTLPTKHGDKYVVSSFLTLPYSEWASHKTVTCKVAHEGMNFEEVLNRSDYA